MAKWMEEELETGLRFSYRLKNVLGCTQTEYQKVDFFETEPFGKALVIDGLLQSADVDERVYHECLVHPALLQHANPKRVFIGGGGEGSTAREVLKHKSVEKCVMVDIDEAVVRFCRENLPDNEDTFKNPRLELIIDDAKVQLEKAEQGYDVIIMDVDDPLESGPCYDLYTRDWYQLVRSKLNPGGIMVTQSSSAGVKSHPLVFSPVRHTLLQVFPTVRSYSQAVYSFGDEWGWHLAFTQDPGPAPDAAEIDGRIAERITGDLHFLDGESFLGIFSLSKAIRKTLAEETKVLSRESPAFLPGSGVAGAR